MEALYLKTELSNRIGELMRVMAPVNHFFANSAWAQRRGDPEICDFMVGNPQELPLPDFVSALQKWSTPQNKDWYGYKDNEPTPQTVVAQSLQQQLGLPFEAQDIFLTNGAFAALSVTLATIVDPGDEVIFISPPWFFYETLITAAGATPVRVKCDPVTFDLDLEAIGRAITAKTRAIIINSPNIIGSLRAEHFDPSKDLKAYAQAVARYTALRSLASRRRFFLVGGRGRPEPREPRSAEDDAILGQLVRKALESLGDECRRMIMAYFLQERTYAELAVELGVPVGTVKSRLFRCLKRAHAILSGRGRAAALQREVT